MILIKNWGVSTLYKIGTNTQASAEEWRQALGLTNCLLGLSEGGLRHSPKGRLIDYIGGDSYGE